MNQASCELCNNDGGEVLFRGPYYRVVRVLGAEGDSYPGFCRVIWSTHIKEMSDLGEAERALFMSAVFRLEAALRDSLQPEKINLASLGNMTPHLHWHVIPRFSGDPTFPKPIWATEVAASPQIDKLGGDSKIRINNSLVEWVGVVRKALNHMS